MTQSPTLGKGARTMPRSLFISLEGLDGSGKSTQAVKLAEWLTQEGMDAETTRQPGGTELGEELREIVVKGEKAKLSPLQDLAIFSAIRAIAVDRFIKPKLAAGITVVSDRFHDSSTVFQGYVDNVPFDTIEKMHQMSIGDTKPDLTIIIDIEAEEALRRANARQNDETRFESAGLEYHKKIRTSFLQLAQKEPERFLIVPGHGTKEEVFERLQSNVLDWLSINGLQLPA